MAKGGLNSTPNDFLSKRVTSVIMEFNIYGKLVCLVWIGLSVGLKTLNSLNWRTLNNLGKESSKIIKIRSLVDLI